MINLAVVDTLSPALRRRRQEFEASLVYAMSTRIARATQKNHISEKGDERGWRGGGEEDAGGGIVKTFTHNYIMCKCTKYFS